MGRVVPMRAVVTHHLPSCMDCGVDMVTVEREWFCPDCSTAELLVFETREPVSLRESFPNRSFRRSRTRQTPIGRLAA